MEHREEVEGREVAVVRHRRERGGRFLHEVEQRLDVILELGLLAVGVAGGEEDHVALVRGGADELVGLDFDFRGVDVGGGHGLGGAEVLRTEPVFAVGEILASGAEIDGLEVLDFSGDDDCKVGFLLFVDMTVEVTVIVMIMMIMVVMIIRIMPKNARIFDKNVAFFIIRTRLGVSHDDLLVAHAVLGGRRITFRILGRGGAGRRGRCDGAGIDDGGVALLVDVEEDPVVVRARGDFALGMLVVAVLGIVEGMMLMADNESCSSDYNGEGEPRNC